MPSSSITPVDIESGLNTGDALLTTVTVGGAIVGMEKVAPKSIKNKMKRQKSYLKKKAEEIKSKTVKKIELGKKKLKNFNLKDKINKFKNSKTHKEFTEK